MGESSVKVKPSEETVSRLDGGGIAILSFGGWEDYDERERSKMEYHEVFRRQVMSPPTVESSAGS